MKICMFGGNLGAGKMYQMQKHFAIQKSNGLACACISFADPIKTILKTVIGYSKNDVDRFKTPTEQNQGYLTYEAFTRMIIEGISRVVRCFVNEDYIYHMSKNEMSELYLIYKGMTKETFKFSYQRMMQILGTEIGQKIDKEIWVRHYAIQKIVELMSIIDVLYIDDLRFYHEANVIYRDTPKEISKEIFIVEASEELRQKRRTLNNDQFNTIANHQSEKEVEIIKQNFEHTIITSEEGD